MTLVPEKLVVLDEPFKHYWTDGIHFLKQVENNHNKTRTHSLETEN